MKNLIEQYLDKICSSESIDLAFEIIRSQTVKVYIILTKYRLSQE